MTRKTRNLTAVLIGLIIVTIGAYLSDGCRRVSDFIAFRPTATTQLPKPKVMFHFNHEPTTSDERAMWDWWLSKTRTDPQFEWKTPLNFYGRVLDQHSAAVDNANVWFAWNDVEGSHERNVRTDAAGRFELVGVQGKRLTVQVAKEGYAKSQNTKRSFEYAAFWDETFHTPSKDAPVAFTLWKLDRAEPLLFWSLRPREIGTTGERVWFDTRTGRFGAVGDVAFSTVRTKTYAPRQFDWSLTVEAALGGALCVSNDELLFSAPETGYNATWTENISGERASFSIGREVSFYLRTPDGKYAAIRANVTHMSEPKAEIKVTAFVNPSGSRNLQYDPAKRLNPQ